MILNASKVTDIVLALCALVLTGVVIRREVISRRPVDTQRPVAVSNWGAVRSAGHWIGPDSAPITIVEFSDFQCPFCAKFAREVMGPMRRLHPGEFAVRYRHWPLPMHAAAFDAAVAAECAATFGRFEQFHDSLFAGIDSIGSKSFERFAFEAGISDTSAFRTCRRSQAPVARVTRDREMARALGSGGTPTFVVNGMLLRGPLDSARLDSLLRANRR